MTIIFLYIAVIIISVMICVAMVILVGFYHKVKDVTNEIHKTYSEIQEKLDSLERR